MKDLVQAKSEPGKLAGEEQARGVYAHVSAALEREEQVSVDMEGIESLSPSFAYEAFGKLVDRFGFSVGSRIRFENDPLRLSSRVIQALDRRKRVVEENSRNR